MLLRSQPIHVNLKPGQQKVVRLAFHGRVKQNTIAAGNHFLIATLQSTMDVNAGNSQFGGGQLQLRLASH